MLGPWKGAQGLGELVLKTGWGKTKPALSAVEVQFAELLLGLTAHEEVPLSVEDVAKGLEVGGETLRKRIDQRKRARKVKEVARGVSAVT
jgi:hypothetical protein